VSIWIAALLIVAAVAMFVAAPLAEGLFDRRRESGDAEMRRFEHQRSLAVQALRELDFDHQMGKLDQDDYRNLRSTLENRALAAMSALERGSHQVVTCPAIDSGESPPLDGESVGRCPTCGTLTGAAQNFCIDCGAALALSAM
jgi:cytochrome c-type biogenesis protein CcmI